MDGEQKGKYYPARKAHLLKTFDQFAVAAEGVLSSRYGGENAVKILHEVQRQYGSLLPQLPYIGGKKNQMTETLIMTATSLALFKTLRARGETTEAIAQLHQQAVEAFLSAMPVWRFRLMRGLMRTRLGLALAKRSLKRGAEASHRREYAEDFVFNYVEGDGQAFDFGVDYRECAIVKFFEAQGAAEFTPYVCLFDYPQSRLSGTGLVRTMTLAEGKERCDFRFRIGQEPENRQETQIDTV